MHVLVTGGCGYIGSHTILNLIENGHNVYCIDNLSNSSRESLDAIKNISGIDIPLHNFDLRDSKALSAFFEQNPIDAIIHFAALKSVPESVAQFSRYYDNNITSLINIIDCCKVFKIKYLVFSSSCSTYGNAVEIPVTEMTPAGQPNSPYALTKKIGEDLVSDASQYLETRCSILRYFNPAGAHPTGMLGEYPTISPSNLVPAICKAAAKLSLPLQVFGNDYPTPDGTCIRDYLHVCDLAQAHEQALTFLEKSKTIQCSIHNLGMGKGISVLEAITLFENSNQVKVPYEIVGARPGDVVEIFANAGKANKELHWTCQFSAADIMTSAWKWQQALLGNYAK